MNFEEVQQTAAATDDDALLIRADNGARGGAGVGVWNQLGAVNFHLRVLEHAGSAGPGRDGADETVQLDRWPRPFDAAVLAGEFADVRGLRVVLFFARRMAGGQRVERFLESGGGSEGEFVVKG